MNDTPFAIRVNTLNATSESIRTHIRELFPDAQVEPVAWYSDALVISNVSKEVLQESEWYLQGKIYLQNLSSMLPALVLDPKPGECVLDMCAAPGSKTTQIGAMMKNTGELVVNDTSRTRMFKLQAQLKKYGIVGVTHKQQKGEFLWRQYQDYFDKVLLDAPCSMDQDVSNKKIKLLAKQQQFLLRSALACAKPGGTIVYATCTSRSEENEAVIEWLSHKEAGVFHIEKIIIPGVPESFITPEGFIRIAADDVYESFFVAKLTKC